MATNDNSLRLSGWLRKTDHGAGHRPCRGKLKRAGAEQPAGTKEGVHHQWKLLTAPRHHHHHHVLVLSWTTSCGCGVNWTVSGSAQHLLFWTEAEEWRGRGGKKNTLYLENHYRIRELLQGVNKILNYSSSIQLILDPLKEEKNASQCNRSYYHHLACR